MVTKNKSNEILTWGIILIVAIVAVVVFNNWSGSPAQNQQQATTTPTGTQSSQTTGTTKTNPNLGPASISYQDALALYSNARIQINTQCQATPTTVTFKNGSKIMIDNRSSIAHSIKVGSTFSLPAYGFKIVTLSSATLPATWLIDCDTHQNIATISIQK